MNITAVPDGTHTYLMDCDECGPLGVVDRAVLHHTAHTHLHAHGIETPPMTECSCGYDYDRITGHPQDTATCTRCTWTMHGKYADHSGHHHYLDTGHIWDLAMGNKV